MYVKEVTVENQVGLHARPATFFIQKANEFKSSIWVEKEERRGDAALVLQHGESFKKFIISSCHFSGSS